MKKELALLSLSVFLAGTIVECAIAQVQPQRGGRGGAGQPRRSAPAGARQVDPRLEKILLSWEAKSAQIKTLRAEFAQLYYDEVFGQRDPDTGRVQPDKGRGELVYQAPDKGIFRVYEHGEKRGLFDFDRDRERWVCTGTEVYQYDTRERKVTVTPLPPELQGQAISEGPLPFIFGMKAEQAKRRYGLRLVKIGGLRAQDVCIEVIPRRQADLENFSRALVILDTDSYLPRAIRIDDRKAAAPEQGERAEEARKPVSHSVYLFYRTFKNRRGQRVARSTIEVNPRISGGEFRTPTRGYRVIRNERLVADDAAGPASRQSGLPRGGRNR